MSLHLHGALTEKLYSRLQTGVGVPVSARNAIGETSFFGSSFPPRR